MLRFIKRLLFSLFIAGATTGICFSSLGIIVSRCAGTPEQADVIIVLGGDKGLRVQKGAELYNRGYAPAIILTGIDRHYYRPGHPNWRERRMIAMGVPKEAIMVDTKSETTWEEAENTTVIMEKRGWRRAIIVSDPPHLLRLHLTWSRAFKGSSKQFILVPTHPKWWSTLVWWNNDKSFQFVLNEVKKNLFYAFEHY